MHLHPPRRSVSTAVVLFQVCPILDSNRNLEVYRDVSYSEVIMRTILPFIFAAWIVMPAILWRTFRDLIAFRLWRLWSALRR